MLATAADAVYLIAHFLLITKQLHILAACVAAVFSSHTLAEVKISYGAPEGFSTVEMDNAASHVATFHGKTLPGFISYSISKNARVLNAQQYTENGIGSEDSPGAKWSTRENSCLPRVE